jgi:mycoredoxin
MEKIILYGTNWCGGSKRAQRILDQRQIEYNYIDIDQDKAGEVFVKETNRGFRSVPTIVFPDKSILTEPSSEELEAKLDSISD